MDGLKLASNEVHVADIRTCVLHPASETHRQLTDEQLVAAGINPGMMRFSCGLENIEDIIEDIEQSLEQLQKIKRVYGDSLYFNMKKYLIIVFLESLIIKEDMLGRKSNQKIFGKI